MEKNKMDKMEVFSCRLNSSLKEEIATLVKEGEFSTVGQLMQTLVDNYYTPLIKVREENKELEQLRVENAQLKELNKELQDNMKSSQTVDSENITKKQQEIEVLRKEISDLQQEIDSLRQTADGKTLISLDPLNLEILKYVAEREAKKRNQNWTIDDVINYFVHFRFEKGSLNGDINSVSDKVIKELKEKL